MKKILCIILSVFMFASTAYASGSSYNDLYNIVEMGNYFFCLPDGFYEVSNDGTISIYQNDNDELLAVSAEPSELDFSDVSNDEALSLMDSIFAESFGDEWAGALYSEKSGGCYKVGSILMGSNGFIIVAATETSLATVVFQNLDLSNGYDLPHGVFKTLSFVE